MVVVPKPEHQDIDLAILPSLKQQGVHNDTLKVGEIADNKNGQRLDPTSQDAAVKIEETAEDVQDLPEDYQNNFARHLAAFRATSTSESSHSARQDVYRGSIRDRRDHAHVSTSRGRSRSPTRFTPSNARRVSSTSQMFFPEVSGSHDSSLRTISRSPHSRIRNDTSRGSLSTTSPPAQDPPSNDGYDDPGTQCRCPDDYKCEHRSAGFVDCRPLVREWNSWKDREDQEAFDRYVHAWLADTY